MNQKNTNPYGNYGHSVQQGQTPYYSTMQPGGQPQQPMYQQIPQMQPGQMQQQPIPVQMQVPGPGQQAYLGGPLEASGGLLVPATITSPSKSNPAAHVPGMLPIDQAYIENILRLNKGKLVTIYMTFRNNPEYPSKAFTGLIESAGRDHIILSDPQTGTVYVLLTINLDYATFDEPIEMDKVPFNYATYAPR